MMKRFPILLLALVATIAVVARPYRAEEIPNVQLADRTRYASNPDGILSAAAVTRIDSLCGALRARGIAQVAVVAVDDIAGDDVFDFAIDLFRKWGVGRAGDDNGLGILLVKDRHEIRFVTGEGLEGVLPDALCKRIQLEYMLPAFRLDDYDSGMVAGVQAVSNVLTGSELDTGIPDSSDGEWPVGVILVFVLGIVGFLFLLVWGNMRRRRCPRCRQYTLTQTGQRVVGLTKHYRTVEYTYVCSNCGQTVRRQERNVRDDLYNGGGGPLIGGFGGGRGFGGGGSFGGGFGGGSFGGGGAGSRW